MDLLTGVINDVNLHTHAVEAEDAAFRQQQQAAQVLHREQMAITTEQFSEKRHHRLLFHARRIIAEKDIARRDAIRDAVTYKNSTAQSVMSVDAVLLGSIFAVIYQFEPAEDSTDAWLSVVSFFVAGSVFALLLSVGFGILFHAKIIKYNASNEGEVYQPCGKTHSHFNGYYSCHCLWAETWAVRSLFAGLALTVLAAGCYQYIVYYDVTLNPYVSPGTRHQHSSVQPTDEADTVSSGKKAVANRPLRAQSSSGALKGGISKSAEGSGVGENVRFSVTREKEEKRSAKEIISVDTDSVIIPANASAGADITGEWVVRHGATAAQTEAKLSVGTLRSPRRTRREKRRARLLQQLHGVHDGQGEGGGAITEAVLSGNASNNSKRAMAAAAVDFVNNGTVRANVVDDGSNGAAEEEDLSGEAPAAQGPGALFLAFCVVTALWVVLSRWLIVGRTRAGTQDLIGYDYTGESLLAQLAKDGALLDGEALASPLGLGGNGSGGSQPDQSTPSQATPSFLSPNVASPPGAAFGRR